MFYIENSNELSNAFLGLRYLVFINSNHTIFKNEK